MYTHLQEHNLIHKYQSGFRPKHSCQTALTQLIETWLKSINNNEITGTVFLDFKKAFDLVNHNILLKKLDLYFPNSPINTLLKSYLTDRYQYVYLNGNKSNTNNITTGVPQGSVLGPLFFLLYINDLPIHLNSDTQNNLFADDASLHTSNEDIEIIQNILQDSLDKTTSWCNKNSMVLHPDKTKCMIITTRQKQQRTHPKLILKLDTSLIEEVKSHKMLGLIIDSHLTWNTHIESTIKHVSKNIFLLKQLKKYTSTKNLKLYFDAHIMSHLNYASNIYDGCSQDTFKKLNSIHRRAVKHLIDPITQATDEKIRLLKILPLKKQFEYNKTLLIHKIYNEKTPSYLNKLIQKPPNRYNSKNLIMPKPRIDLFKTSLSFSGTYIWNGLPQDLKVVSSEKSFKNKLLNILLNNNQN